MLTVRTLMTASPDTVAPKASLHEVLKKMNRDGCRQLPVINDGKLVGIITDRDVRLAVNSPVLQVEEDFERVEMLDGIMVDTCMTKNPITVSPDESAYKVADTLSLYKYGALPVVENDALVGIISVIDYLRYFAAQGED